MPTTEASSQRPGRLVFLVSHVHLTEPPSRLAREVLGVAERYKDAAEIQVVDQPLAGAVAYAQALERADAVDVFICAGATGDYLRRHLSAPVVLMRVSGFDLLAALVQAGRVARKVGILSYREVSRELEEALPLFPLEVRQAAYTTLKQAQERVNELAADGCQVIIGSSMVTELAEQAGLTGILVVASNAIRQAFDDAMAILRSTRADAAKRQRLDTILHHLTDGVLAIAQDGTVQSLNPAMAEFLGVSPEWAVGRSIREVAPAIPLESVLQSLAAEEGRIITHGDRTIVASMIPLFEDGVPAGAVLTSQETAAVQRTDRRIRSSTRPSSFTAKYRLSQILGEAPSIRSVVRLAERYSQTDSTVLIAGESGTGKELFAQGIHNASRRCKGPFVAINCAAFPETLLESELFGYEEGAFSGSRKGGKPGLFESAHTGTIFLDEIGDMPLSLQTRLLRVLQEREVLRLGGTEPTPVDVRVLTATNRDLRERIAAGEFREDLFYRVNILRLQLPALRERKGDIPAIARRILADVSRRCGTARNPERLLGLIAPFLESYSWPGNIRELENVLERAALAMADLPPQQNFSPAHLHALIPELFAASDAAPGSGKGGASNFKSIARAVESTHVRRALEECGGNVERASRQLGISRSTLWRRLKSYKAESTAPE
jgi:propionate catabolism operon transcriptional regulator